MINTHIVVALATMAALSGVARAVEVPAGSTAAKSTIEPIEVARADGSKIDAYVDHGAAPRSQSLLLILQGSECREVGPQGPYRMQLALPAGFARLDIEKYGLGGGRSGDGKACPTAYLQHNAIDQRVTDVLTVVAYLRQRAPWWNGRLYLMGASEGATIAALAGPLIAETKGIILINGSIGRPFSEGWKDAMVASVRSKGGDAAAVDGIKLQAEQIWAEARSDPRWDKQAFGANNTLKWWASIIDLRPANTLQLTNAPILLMQSDRDEMTPVESARALAREFEAKRQANFTYVELSGLSHGLRTADGKPGWAPVLDRIRVWLLKNDK